MAAAKPKISEEERLQKNREYQAAWYAKLTPEKKAERFEASYARKRAKGGRSAEEKAARREYERKAAAERTAEERARRAAKSREYYPRYPKRTRKLSPEQREKNNSLARARGRTYTAEQKERKAAYLKEYLASKKEKTYAGHLARKYGMTASDYAKALEAQGGVCALCGGVNSDGKRIFVDHSHETGKVRALLCRLCNLAIGSMREDPALMRRAADYVESWAKL